MKKSDLRTGMWVELRNGDKSMVMIGTTNGDVIVDENSFSNLDNYNEDFDGFSSNLDIMKVFSSSGVVDMFTGERQDLIWERKNTVKELQELINKINELPGVHVVAKQFYDSNTKEYQITFNS